MIPLLGNVVEIKNFVPTNQDPKINQERSHTRFSPLLTNGCSGRRVGEAGGCSGSSRSRSPTNSPSIYPTNKSLEQISEKKKKLLEKDQSYDPSTGIHTSRSSNPAALRRPEKNATKKTRGRKP